MKIFKYSNTTLANINGLSLCHLSISPVPPGLLCASPPVSLGAQFCIYALYELYPICFKIPSQENQDLWKWVSGQEQPPEAVNSNPVFVAVREGVKKNLDSHAAPEIRATPGQPWVRGWDDIKKGPDGPVAGNQ